MTNYRNLSIAATMIVTFVVSFVLMSWRSETPGVGVVAGAASPPPKAAAPDTPRMPSASMASNRRAAASSATKTSQVTPPPAMSMPVSLNITRNVRMDTVEALLTNVSDDPITVNVSIFTPSTKYTNKLTYSLAPRGMQFFGTKEGVPLSSGDQITLASPAFESKTESVFY